MTGGSPTIRQARPEDVAGAYHVCLKTGDGERNASPVKFTHGSHTLEVVWSILPAVTLLFIAIYQMNAWADAKLRRPVVIENGQENGLGILKNATDRLGEAIGEIRSISHDLRSSLLDTLGLPAAIGQLAAEFEQRSGLEVAYRSNEFDCRLENGAPVSLFRIAQEGINNILKHAQASHVVLGLAVRDDHVSLRVEVGEVVRGGVVGLDGFEDGVHVCLLVRQRCRDRSEGTGR